MDMTGMMRDNFDPDYIIQRDPSRDDWSDEDWLRFAQDRNRATYKSWREFKRDHESARARDEANSFRLPSFTEAKNDRDRETALGAALNALSSLCHHDAERRGWWSETELTNEGRATKIALMHSELSEALEGMRKGVRDYHLPERLSEEVELADTVIRILDYAAALDMDIGGAVIDKLRFNRVREDHGQEARKAEGGKAF